MSDDFIYRAPSRGAKSLSLHREQDWLTGLSFLDYPYGITVIKFSVAKLREAGYAVINDSLQSARLLPHFGATLYIEPNSGESWSYPEGHHTVYHPDKAYWDAWHQADAANLNTPEVSEPLKLFYELREED